MKDPVTGYGRDPVHGHGYGSRTYESWRKMVARCTNPKHDAFPYYGGRGIKIDARWLVFGNFLADMGVRPDGMTLGRINNDGNYEKSNCEWATHLEQMRNRRNTNWFSLNGEAVPLVEAARRLGIWPNSIRQRLNRGWSKERIVEHYSCK